MNITAETRMGGAARVQRRAGALALTGEPAVDRREADAEARTRCRTNSRRGITDPAQRSYPSVEAVRRGLDVLRAVNRLGIASVNGIHKATGIPKPTVVRMLETLAAEGYVARDNMCGGYRVTSRVHELNSGYQGIPEIIEASRARAIELTRRIGWPIGIGVIDGDAIALKFWTGAISPWAHTNTVLGLRPDLVSTAMGRAYLAFCAEPDRERHLRRLRADPARGFGEAEERRFRALLERVRGDGYATRDPRTKPYRTTTLAMPIREGEAVDALISISFFTTAVAKSKVPELVVAPLRTLTTEIEAAIAQRHAAAPRPAMPAEMEIGF